ncbi:MAG: GNAT family N-acetyltransferase [Syntrophorhabdales bacterium]|jgi:hypothetical protein
MSGMPWIKNMGKQMLAARCAAAQGLRVKLFRDWQPELDEALESLPENELLPHDLFRSLMKMTDPKMRQISLIREHGVPVALAGLRNRWGYWEPVTQWIVPGVLFPVKEGYMSRVLPALDLQIQIAWWRWNEPPPKMDCIKQIKMTPTRGMSCSEDFEHYWRRSGHMKTIQKARNRCKGFELRTNTPNAAEWTIRNWDAKWRTPGTGESPDLAERLLVARCLEERGLHHTLLLSDKDEPVAGGTLMADRNEVVLHCNYRNPKYDWYSVMNRLAELTFYWAKERGFTKIDMGGSFDYKEKWAPEAGQKWEFTVCPEYVLYKGRISVFAGKVRNGLKRCSGRPASLNPSAS